MASRPNQLPMEEIIKQNKLLIILTFLVCIGVLIFNVFHFSANYGIVEINNVNSLLLVPFIILVCWLGMTLGSNKKRDDLETAFQSQLSDREKEVFELVLIGKKNQEIANELFVDISTVKSHINNIYKKTGVKNRKELRFLGQKELKRDGIS